MTTNVRFYIYIYIYIYINSEDVRNEDDGNKI